MQKILWGLLLVLLISSSSLYAKDVTTVEATDGDISDNLDLEAVASVFGEAKDLEDFEKKLNDPETEISNLDLNDDGEVDYLRVTEVSKGDTNLVTIQATIGKDQYQDVATIDVEKKGKDEGQVQVVGDVYMYGPGYIVEPVYVHPPVIFVFFWSPIYHPWRSPYYWGYYPPYYHPRRPYSRNRYQTNVKVNINVNNSYSHTSVRKSKTSIDLQKDSRRNDFGSKNPDKSFSNRNDGVKNRQEMTQKRDKPQTSKAKKSEAKATTSRPVQKDWKPAAERTGTKSNVKGGKDSAPAKKAPSKAPAKSSVKSSPAKSKQQIGKPSRSKPAGRSKPAPKRRS